MVQPCRYERFVVGRFAVWVQVESVKHLQNNFASTTSAGHGKTG
jgi:hypothetical protein